MKKQHEEQERKQDRSERLRADNVDHLRTEGDSEVVVGTEDVDRPERDRTGPPTERFRQDTDIDPVSLGHLPKQG